MLTWFLSSPRQEVFFTHTLSQFYPQARKFQEQASGLLAISIFLNQTSYHIFWLRPEVIHTVNWGGNPNDISVLINKDGSFKLSPRLSFKLWQETVKEQSLPWQQIEIDAALELRNTLI